MHQFHKFILSWNSPCFGQFVCPSSGVYSLHVQQWYMSYRFVDRFRAGPGWNWVPSWFCSKAVYKPGWHIPLLSVKWINSWWWTDELSETWRVSGQNKFVKLMHLFGFITKSLIYLITNSDSWNTWFSLFSGYVLFLCLKYFHSSLRSNPFNSATRRIYLLLLRRPTIPSMSVVVHVLHFWWLVFEWAPVIPPLGLHQIPRPTPHPPKNSSFWIWRRKSNKLWIFSLGDTVVESIVESFVWLCMYKRDQFYVNVPYFSVKKNLKAHNRFSFRDD